MTENTTILIVDDHAIFRVGVKTLLNYEVNYQVIAEADAGIEGVEKAIKFQPDVALVNLSLPDFCGIEIGKKIKNAVQKANIIILGISAQVNNILKAFKAGMIGFVVKDSPIEIYIRAVDSASRGEYFFDPAVSEKIIRELLDHYSSNSRLEFGKQLTRREKEITMLLAEGSKPKQIAEKLLISPKTVENHRYNIMKKLNVHSTHEIIKYAVKKGLVDVGLWK